jgi:hypothetical protein
MMNKRIEKREERIAGSGPRGHAILYLLTSILFLAAGCTDNHNAPTSQPLTMEEKQQQLLNDPFGYKTDTTKVDITGGDITHFDKDAFKKDVDHVLSP